MMKFTKEKIMLFELFLVVCSLFSFPYVMATGVSGEAGLLFDSMVDFVDFLFEPMIPVVSAQVAGCCLETNDGNSCVISTENNCASTFSPGATCNTVSFCELGCCYDDDEGIYDQNVLQSACTAEWSADAACNLPGAALGCCVLGETTRFETEGQCRVHAEVFALNEDYELDWRTGVDEISCILLAGEQKTGACVMDNSDCDFGTEADCYSLGGEFHEDLLCTAPDLETACEMTEETTCVDGKDQVYFKDSCGNIANIYDSTKAKDPEYWRKKVEPVNACGAGSGNANSATCGNCDRFKGGICNNADEDDFTVSMGDYYCRDTSCNYKGETYRNGEAWCEYDGPINEGDDAPGSRHFRYICNAGEVQVEPCADFRNEICIEQNTLSTTASAVTGDTQFSNAYCRKNNAKHCIEIGETSMAACRDEPDCMVRSVDVGGSFNFDICVPQYPEGFSFESQYQASGSQVCAINTRTCVATYKSVFGACVCIDNCVCPSNPASYNAQMTEVCEALGDCKGSSYVENWNEVQPTGQIAPYDSRVEKYMLAAGLGPGDNLGVGSALFEQSAFAGSLFAPDIDSNKGQVPTAPEDPGTKIGGILTALGGLLASLAGVLQQTFLAILGAALSLFGALLSMISGGPCPPTYHDFNCRLYEPPIGGNTCDSCNGDPDRPCTAYRCNTLGTACEFINEGTEDELCIAGVDDGGFPIVTQVLTMDEIIEQENLYDFPELLAFMQNVTYESVSPSHIRITNKNGGCLDAYSPAPISFKTQEPAQCKFDTQEKEFEDMQFYVGLSTYTYDHTTFFQLPDPSHGSSQGLDVSDELDIYVKCRDRFGHEMPEYILIEMCVNEGPDETPPRIVTSSPKDGDYISFGSDDFTMTLITNELATCRWSYDESALYDTMTNNFICNDTFLTPSTTMGYRCSATLPINQSAGSMGDTFYVKCSDQPWLAGTSNEGERNSNVEPFVYMFSRPEDSITIDSMQPSEDLVSTSDEYSVDLRVVTKYGALNHTCSYSFHSAETTILEMYETGYRGTHIQPLTLPPGKYTIYVTCEDETGDLAEDVTSFEVIKKSSAPQISRVWQNFNTMYFVTQEDADCRYVEDSCRFNFTDGQAVSGDGILHRISVVKGRTYYVKCQDEFENEPLGCSVVLSSV